MRIQLFFARTNLNLLNHFIFLDCMVWKASCGIFPHTSDYDNKNKTRQNICDIMSKKKQTQNAITDEEVNLLPFNYLTPPQRHNRISDLRQLISGYNPAHKRSLFLVGRNKILEKGITSLFNSVYTATYINMFKAINYKWWTGENL